jgi:hypothetical protein
MHPSMQRPSGPAAGPGPAGVAAGGARAARLSGRAGDAVPAAPARTAVGRAAEPGFAARHDVAPAAGGAGDADAQPRQQLADGPQDDEAAASSGPAAASQDKPAADGRQPKRRSSGARSRRSSVPSWDEIMFGNSRQPD